MNQTEEGAVDYNDDAGVAFSGGGIRSAAFCSGVLRRILQLKVQPGYLSCVSGGGYTGTAYLDWKCRHGNKDDPEWHEKFFDNMRTNTGYVCDCEPCCEDLRGCMRSGLGVVLHVLVMLFLTVIVPVVGWCSTAFTVAYVVDVTVGPVLRGRRYRCDEATEDCEFPEGSKSLHRMLLFVIPLGLCILLHVVTRCSSCSSCCRTCVESLKVASFSLFLVTFLPWFIHDYIDYTPDWLQIIVFVVSVSLWFLAPPAVRRYCRRFNLWYTFSYVVHWRVYKETFLGSVQYDDNLFMIFLSVSGIVLSFASWFGALNLRLVHSYYRWLLKRAFYKHNCDCKICKTDQGDESHRSCCSCDCRELFPGTCLWDRPNSSNDVESQQSDLRLHQLRDTKPEYIANVTINGWRKFNTEASNQCGLMTMTPSSKTFGFISHQPTDKSGRPDVELGIDNIASSTGVEPGGDRVKSPKDVQSDGGKKKKARVIGPEDVNLSAAMATSAAAVSAHRGAYRTEEEPRLHILTSLGIEMAALVKYEDNECDKCESVCLVIVKFVIMVGPILVPVFAFRDNIHVRWPLLFCYTPTLAVIVVFFLAVVCSFCCKDCFKSTFCRKMIVHVPLFRFLCSVVDIHTGPDPPAMLHLSDGGYFENLGILALFQRRLKKIVVVDGGYVEPNRRYGEDLVNALKLAREMLGCSFIGTNGEDVLFDIRENFANTEREHNKKDGENREKREKKGENGEKKEEKRENKEKQGENREKKEKGSKDERREGEGNKRPDVTWEEAVAAGEDAERVVTKAPDTKRWGPGPVLLDVKDLPFCCCACCRCDCTKCLGSFPHHVTGNQFFTRSMFSAYHREGYRACRDAAIDGFFRVESQPVTEYPVREQYFHCSRTKKCPAVHPVVKDAATQTQTQTSRVPMHPCRPTPAPRRGVKAGTRSAGPSPEPC